MYQYIFHQLNLYRALLCAFAVTAILFLYIQCITLMVFHRPAIPAPIRTRLYPGMPLTIDLRPYSLPHPNDLRLSQLTADYHSRRAQACFLIEHLDGGPWWSYVTNEFAEILAHLRQIGRENNITYRSFPTHIALDYQTDLRKYFLDACDMHESVARADQKPIVILLWNINRLLWYQMRRQWNQLFLTTRVQVIVFIDDLHFATGDLFYSRQFIFRSVASEILSTYPYLFHNYYPDVPPSKITWLPHATSASSYQSINTSADQRLLLRRPTVFLLYETIHVRPCDVPIDALRHCETVRATCQRSGSCDHPRSQTDT